jgi:hypothetical protein
MQKKALILAKFGVFGDVPATFFPKLSFDDSFLASHDHANALMLLGPRLLRGSRPVTSQSKESPLAQGLRG